MPFRIPFVILIGNVAKSLAAEEPTADCSYSYLNHCGKDFMVYSVIDGVFGTPVSEVELEEHCRRQEAAAECVRRRTENCTTGVIKGIARFMMDSVNDERDIRCDSSTPEHKTYLKIASCLNSLSKHTLRCMSIFRRKTDMFAETVVGKTLKQKIPQGCCIFNEYVSCVVEETRRVCGKEAATFNENLTAGAVGDLIASACESYTPGDKKCEAFAKQAPPIDDETDENFAFLGTVAKISDAMRTKRS